MQSSKSPRHPSAGGYARGEETRRRLIDVAIRLFGERGYEGASSREIAREAGVNAPALQYYFDSKEGLYQACALHLAETAATHFAPAITVAETLLARDDATPAALIEAFLGLQDSIADFLLCGEEAQQRRLFIAQEQSGNGASAAELERPERHRMGHTCSAIIARLTGRPVDDPLTRLRQMTANGQLMVFHVVPRTALQAMGWQHLEGENLAFLKQTVRAQTRVLISSWMQEAGKPA